MTPVRQRIDLSRVDALHAVHKAQISRTRGLFVMAIQRQPFVSEPAADKVAPVAARLTLWGRGIVRWIDAFADYYAAAALYEHLRRLSDAELQRRGLSRETLARDVCASCDR